MFSFLKELDYRLFERYRTLERNIKSASNSFYDSYLDLQEQFLRIVLEKEGVETIYRYFDEAYCLKYDDTDTRPRLRHIMEIYD